MVWRAWDAVPKWDVSRGKNVNLKFVIIMQVIIIIMIIIIIIITITIRPLSKTNWLLGNVKYGYK